MRHRHRQLVARHGGRDGLHDEVYRFIAGSSPPLSVRQLARIFGMTERFMGRVVGRMVEAGRIRRQRAAWGVDVFTAPHTGEAVQ